jgi:predicted AAA+ superfamily ATPase
LLIKERLHKGENPRFFFWQNKTRQEIDLIIDHPDGPVPIEIKSGMTINESYLSNLKYWQKVSGDVSGVLSVIYGGDTNLNTKSGNFISWRSLKDLEL